MVYNGQPPSSLDMKIWVRFMGTMSGSSAKGASSADEEYLDSATLLR